MPMIAEHDFIALPPAAESLWASVLHLSRPQKGVPWPHVPLLGRKVFPSFRVDFDRITTQFSLVGPPSGCLLMRWLCPFISLRVRDTPAQRSASRLPNPTQPHTTCKVAKLGEGTYGTVYLAEDKTTNTQVAAKIMRSERGEVSGSELYRLAHVQGHRHIVQLHDGVCNPYLVIMLMESGCMSLHQYLKGGGSFPSSSGGSVPPLGSALPKLSGGIAPKPFAVALGHQIASALDHIHSKDIIHLDLYSKNIVFRQDGTAMLVDFGMSINVTNVPGTKDYVTLFICLNAKEINNKSKIFIVVGR